MKRLVYSPYVQAYVKADDGVIDISPYLVSGSINRKVNQVSSASLVLRNPVQGNSSRLLFTEYMGSSQPEPHPMFHPMDPIIIVMQRLQGHPVQVFTGYIDTAPYIQLYPGLCKIEASCTLKRLLYTQWDASLPAVQNFLEQFGWIPNGSGIWNPTAEEGRVAGNAGKLKGQFTDGSIGALLFAILNQIGDWDASTIWIESLPPQIKQIVVKLYNQITPNVQQGEAGFESLLQQVLGSGSFGGANPGAPGNGTLDGNYTIKRQKPTAAQAALVKQVMDIAAGFNAPKLAVQALLEACIQENSFTNNAGGTGSSNGLLQVTGPTAADHHISPFDVNACVNVFLTKGFAGSGGAVAIATAQPTLAPNAVAQLVQGSGAGQNDAGASTYGAWINEANAIMSSYRSNAATGANPNTTAPGTSPAQTPAQASDAAKFGVPGRSPGGKTGKPNADGTTATSGNLANVAAVATAALQRQDQFHCFHYEQRRPIQYDLTKGTVYIDCSGFTIACYKAAGLPDPSGNNYNGGGTSGDIFNNSKKIDFGSVVPGDMLLFGAQGSEHVNIYVGNGQAINMGSPGEPKIGPAVQMGPSGFAGYFRSNTAGAAADAATSAAGGGNSMAAAFSTMLELPSIFSMAEAELFTGKRSFIADQPLFPFITQLAAASMRNFMSMPNGNFFAFFPDYFGFFGRKYYWEIRDIEIIDGRIDLSDDPLLTHMAVAGDVTTYSGEVSFADLVLTAGIFDIFDAFTTGYIGQGQGGLPGFNQNRPTYGVINANPVESERTKDAAINFLQRYGARPYVEEVPAIRSPFYELFLAFQNFMIAWSKQFETTFELTFMPELFPGGLVALPDHHIQLYVEEVVHNFDYQQGFTTTVNVSSPSQLKDGHSRANITAGLARPAALKAIKSAAESISVGKTKQLLHRGP